MIMNNPTNLKYSKTHEWVAFSDGSTARIGLTEHAQQALGDIVFANLPQEGDAVNIGEAFGDVESVKAVSDIYSPVTGTVAAVNESLSDEPGQINKVPYEAWLIEVSGITDTEDLLTVEEYEAFCREEA